MPFLELLHCTGKFLVVCRALARNVEPRAQEGHALVAHANFERWPVRNASLVGAPLASSNFGQLGLERKVALGVWLVGVERLARILGLRHRGENLAWVRCALVVRYVAAHA